ncbi:cyclic peptide export ABC transporter [Terasakiella pusilla]|uniref:cyclic peptide export ABC transporter n=1 Tax=Terasakiella pusilla TaxID=64973 RepID=UPI00048AC423|nr:cyclic peptide export ABC transporter [Terasakiella pusilla]
MIKELALFYLGRAKKSWGVIIVMSTLASLAHGMLLGVVNYAVESQGNGEALWGELGLFVLLFLIYLSGVYFSIYKTTEAIGYMMHDLRIELSRKFLKGKIQYIEQYKKGEIYAHFTADIDQLAKTALRLIKTFQAAIVLVFCVLYIAWLSGLGFALLLCGLLCGVAAYLFQHKKARISQTVARDGEAQFFETLNDELYGLKELKLNKNKSDDLFSKQFAISEKFRFHYTKSELFFFISFLVSQISLFIILGLAIFLPQGMIADNTTLHFQILTALLFSLKPIEEVVDSIGSITRGGVALSKIKNLSHRLDEFSEIQNLVSEEPKIPKCIELKNIKMSYRSEKYGESFHLGPLSLQIQKGDTVFIVGGNGSGKTTLLKVLSGLYVPSEGEILIDSHPLSAEDIFTYRQNFSAIYSDFHLFRTLFGLKNPDQEKAKAYLERFKLMDKTSLEGNQYSTVALSTGQKKRLALTTLLLENRPYIIFDEFAADQDPEFRVFFYKELLPELKEMGKTVICVTHDDLFFDVCDHLIKLDLGGVVLDEVHQ